MKPETKFWQKVKKFMPDISFTRLENLSGFGTPDLLCYNKTGTFFTCELKVTKTNSVRLSPHQISFHVRHPKNSFILVFSEKLKSAKLYDGSQVLALASRGLSLESRCSSLESVYDLFESL